MPASVSATFAIVVAVNAASIAMMFLVLGLFSRAQKRRKVLVQTLAVTSDDDDDVMRQWALLERRKRAMRIEYVVSTLFIAAASTAFVWFLPLWS